MQFHIQDMTCGGCVRGVSAAIRSVDPAAEVKADLETRNVEVETQAPRAQLVAALTEAGFAPA
jgi:copper chaperone